ncbi:efflux RND transporter permease subunit [Acinetobacter sp. VNH17]|jgi:hydrophobe/amphiphile efflux-1 (HAE1) family protein|uniref:Efflux RND transporter permease subunit n=1 Tax=Acinetobacter thutiue TaxID=2998078 RepID=A0ABT7WR24_9GAMM|nr:efflux RND transporter permease subunit [Acinetobacter thutiue]MCY6413024.1 efflux RND transporter permease subunit [Acinetobacter thutiue]MDN0015132.1 efflux RND transporter permease subunit [Acinetobacter thutiue]
MNFATWSIRNPIPAILLFVLLTIAGIWGFRSLPTQNLPDLDLPMVTVTVAQPGVAPAQLETEVARKVEDSLASLNGLRHLQTSVTDGLVTIQVEFELEKNISDALIETKNAVDSVRSDLPTEIQEPTVSTRKSVGGSVLTYAVASPKFDEEALSWYVDHTLAKTILGVPGVGRFERIGGVQREVQIRIDPVRMAEFGVTVAEVSHTLRQIQQQSSGGRGQLGEEEQSIRVIATVQQAQELGALRITLSNGKSLRLDQIASITDTTAEHTQAALLNGKPVVGFSVYRAKGYDEVKIAEGVRKVLDQLKKDDPSIELTYISGSVDETVEQYDGSMAMLYEGAILAIIVVWLFLRNWRATLISATALPLSILPAFAAMSLLGYSLNTVTLLALAVVVGILVDDAIVEVENIERHRQMGKPIRQAAEDAVNEIALAVIATTMCLVAVFMPTALMGGIPGMMFRQFGWTAVIAVLASLLVARLLTPMMAVYFLKPEAQKEHKDGRIMHSYLHTVRWCLTHRKTTLFGATLFFVASIMLVPMIPSGFVPASDSGITTVNMELPPGSSLQDTLSAAEIARTVIDQIPGIEQVFTSVGTPQEAGQGTTQAGSVRNASLTLIMSPRGQRESQLAIENNVRQKLENVPGARFSLSGGGPGEKLQLILASDNSQALKATAQSLERELRGIGKLSNITSTASLERPEIVIRPDNQRAAEQGITTASIAEVVRVATSGDFDAQVARLNLDNRQIYIRTSVDDHLRKDINTLSNLRIAGKNGLVPLSSIAELSIENGASQIDRYDRQRYITVTADLSGMALSDAVSAAMQLPSVKAMPSSVKLIQTGDAEIASEFASGFGMAIIFGLLCVFSVLVLLFKDFFQPFTILSAIPLSIGGAFIALMISHSELNVPSMIGLVMLMGIVTKNSILLVEYAILGMRDRGLSQYEALLDACHKRARPIVMTTIAMIAGMLPIALGLGADSSFRHPMAMAVIGGLLTSTALSLLVVPVVFTYVAGLERRLKKLVRRDA